MIAMHSGVRPGAAHPLWVQWVCQGMPADMPPEPPAFHVGHASQVFVAKRHGGVQRVTGGPEDHALPTWSRSGSRISMTAGDRVEIRAVDGHVHQTIRGGPAFTDRVAWSRDGRRVAFVAYRGPRFEDFVGRLVVADRDGSDRRVLAEGADHRPDWSRDGRTLYFLRGRLGSYKRQALYAVSANGGKPRRLASKVDAHSRVLVSPNGRWVLFRRDRALWVVRTDGSAERLVVTDPDNRLPRSYGWMGDAVFGAKSRRHPLVTTLSGRRRVLGARFSSAEYDLSPDGRWIAWVNEDRGGGVTEVRVAHRDGSGERAVAGFFSPGNFAQVATLSWSPDGRRLLIEPYRHIGD